MKKIISFVMIVTMLCACVKKNDTGSKDDHFDRKTLLINMVKHMVVPAFDDFKAKIKNLKTKETAFIDNPSQIKLEDLKEALFQAQKVWQHVAMFDLENNPEANASFRLYMNSYPTDATKIDQIITGTNADFNADANKFMIRSDNVNKQGFLAMDYLVNGITFEKYTTDANKDNRKKYLTLVVDRMMSLTNALVQKWNKDQDKIINNSGSSATASFDVMMNDYLFYTEQGFRTAKIEIPSDARNGRGVNKNPKLVESYYSSKNSKTLFLEAFKAIQNFYYGTYYDGSETGQGIKTYLDYLSATVLVKSQEEKMSAVIETKFKNIQTVSKGLNDDFTLQIKNDNQKMLETYDALQDFIPLLKTNVLQALNVKVDYVDSDGD